MPSLDELAKRVGCLEARLHDLEAAEEIRNLKSRYAELVDARYSRGKPVEAAELARLADEIAALFAEDGVWDGGKTLGLCEGRAAIAARLREPTLLFSWHYFLKPQISVDGEQARARWDLLSPCTTPDGAPTWMAGVEDDEYRKVEGVWLHSYMKLSVVFMAPHETGWTRVFR